VESQLRPGQAINLKTSHFLEDLRLPAFKHHVFVCHNQRPEGAPRPSCTSDGKSELLPLLQQFAKEAGLGSSTVRINKAGCLDQCEHGPTVVVYPDAVWYGNVKPEDCAEIVREHLVGGRPVERLRIADDCLNAKTCPHRS
jgi:(2Fe-2S) ferredoxin